MRNVKEEGSYAGRLIAVACNANKNGTPTFEMTIELFRQWEGGDNWKLIPPFRRNIHLHLTDRAIEYTLEKLKAAGFKGQLGRPRIEDFPEQLRKSEWFICEHKKSTTDPDRVFEEWSLKKWVKQSNEPKSMLEKELSDEARDRLTALYDQYQQESDNGLPFD